jgi:nucleotide-binding universal stress UspA family protein
MRILIAASGDLTSEEVLHFGVRVASRCAEPPTALTIMDLPKSDHAPADAVQGQVPRSSWKEIRAVRRRRRAASPAEEILREAREGNYDLLIVGESEHERRVQHLLQSSAAVRVAERAPCSVMVVKGKRDAIRRILLCDSGANGPGGAPPGGGPNKFGSPECPGGGRLASVSERFVTSLVGLLGGGEEVTVLHVMSQISAGPGVRGKQLRAAAEELIGEHTPEGELLARDVRLLERLGLRARARVRHGLVIDEILAEAQSGDYDLVVIGAPAGEGWRRLLLDDLARKVLAGMDRPVLVVR